MFSVISLVYLLLMLRFFIIGIYNWWIGLLLGAVYFYYSFKNWKKDFKNYIESFVQMSYDESAIYVAQESGDLVVTYEKIKNVELKSLDGIYKFELFDGQVYYCKPSMWYPFNYPKVDAELNKIRNYIKNYKSKYWTEQEVNNALGS